MFLLRLDIILESKNDLTIFHKMFFSPILVKCLTQDPRETNSIQKLKPKRRLFHLSLIRMPEKWRETALYAISRVVGVFYLGLCQTG